MKQPHEDVIGVKREDDLLSLDMEAVPHRAAIAALTHLVWRTTNVGQPAPVVQRISNRINDPQTGDLVVENFEATAMRNSLEKQTRALGYLIERRVEWAYTDEEWAREVAEDPALVDQRVTVQAWYVQYGPAPEDVCRWTDCSFLAVPLDPHEFAWNRVIT